MTRESQEEEEGGGEGDHGGDDIHVQTDFLP